MLIASVTHSHSHPCLMNGLFNDICFLFKENTRTFRFYSLPSTWRHCHSHFENNSDLFLSFCYFNCRLRCRFSFAKFQIIRVVHTGVRVMNRPQLLVSHCCTWKNNHVLYHQFTTDIADLFFRAKSRFNWFSWIWSSWGPINYIICVVHLSKCQY